MGKIYGSMPVGTKCPFNPDKFVSDDENTSAPIFVKWKNNAGGYVNCNGCDVKKHKKRDFSDETVCECFEQAVRVKNSKRAAQEHGDSGEDEEDEEEDETSLISRADIKFPKLMASNAISEMMDRVQQDVERYGPYEGKEVKTSCVAYKRQLYLKFFKQHPDTPFSVLCPCCKEDHIDILNFEAGHIIPRSHGGSTEDNNMIPICKKCNRKMGQIHFHVYVWRTFGRVDFVALKYNGFF